MTDGRLRKSTLTPHEENLRRMRLPADQGGEGKTPAEAATALGLTTQSVYNMWARINRKLGIPKMEKAEQLALATQAGAEQRMIEHASPEVAAAAFDAASDPTADSQRAAIDRVNDELQRAGIPGKVSQAIVRRMRVRYGNAITVKRALTTNEILKGIDEQIFLIDSYIDDKVCAESNLRDLGLVKAALLEKRNLLRGEPTAIISNLDREKLHALIPSMIAEARRRGITVDGTAERVTP